MKCILCISFSCFLLVYQDAYASNSCKLNENSCEECITDTGRCVWCAMVNVNGSRCRSVEENLDDWCVDNKIDPKSEIRSEGKNLPFNSNEGEVVQIKPQDITIALRPGGTKEFNFSIKPADNYPVDLYFLVDASKTMKDIKQKIVEGTEKIYNTMTNLTKNVFLGTGSFIDKNALPFTRQVNSALAYSFRNRLKLTNKTEEFQKILNETEFGVNHDEQEGTLDALAQVCACEHEIGWRNESTKIVIVLTDSPYHSAGDGKWAGINRPYDGKCHTENGVYTNELVMDYPSISIINKLASDREIIIIFVVKKGYTVNIYSALSKAIRGSKVTNFGSDSKSFSMGSLLKEQYEKIRQHLKLRVNMENSLRQYFKFEFDPDCYESASSWPCKIKLAEKKFTGKITLKKYIEQDNVNVDIFAEGINEKLRLNIDIIKKCECSVEKHSVECNSLGDLKCGVCECNPDRHGNKCQCDKKAKGVNPNDNSTCVSPTTPDKMCSGFGVCQCGKCSCISKDYSGPYCECHKYMCPLYKDQTCAGHGDCVCGTCVCEPGFTAPDCRCPLAKDNCLDGDIECNNRGKCGCGSCLCERPSDWDARLNGNLCQLECTNKSCHSHQCQLLEPIALCYLKQEECENNTEISITSVKKFTDEHLAKSTANDTVNEWNKCPNIRTGVGCYTSFQYKYNADSYGIKLEILSDEQCAETYYIYGGVCVSCLVLFGVVTLVSWKVVTTLRDRKEYERFMQEVGISEFNCDNPIYAPATSTFHNPGFRKRSDRRKSRS